MNIGFTSSLDLEKHPMLSAKSIAKSDYYDALCYFTLHQQNNEFVNARLEDYKHRFDVFSQRREDISDTKSVKRIVNTRFRPWSNKYKYWLLCDIAIILLEDQLIINAEKEMEPYTSKRQQDQLSFLLNVLFEKKASIPAFQTAAPLIEQYQKNRRFAGLSEKRYVVTANMSAGKSTFINALMGKPLARTSEEACTGNINCFYNKSFEDGAIHFNSNTLTLHAVAQALTSFSWEKESQFATYFRSIESTENRICIVDTPGVNSAINKRHGSISKEVLQKDTFDKIIYVLNASKLGTDEEIAYIRWISEHVPHEKVIFVLNKLDNYKTSEDDISASINGVRNDLLKYFENPIICPLSARFALLLKMKSYGDQLTPDEEDEYQYFARKFKKPSYDLSKYYACAYPDSNEESVVLSQKCGIYGLEKIL
jgi:GTP-binding protein EngB required for normal cell division